MDTAYTDNFKQFDKDYWKVFHGSVHAHIDYATGYESNLSEKSFSGDIDKKLYKLQDSNLYKIFDFHREGEENAVIEAEVKPFLKHQKLDLSLEEMAYVFYKVTDDSVLFSQGPGTMDYKRELFFKAQDHKCTDNSEIRPIAAKKINFTIDDSKVEEALNDIRVNRLKHGIDKLGKEKTLGSMKQIDGLIVKLGYTIKRTKSDPDEKILDSYRGAKNTGKETVRQ